jgi:hypothetical protein
MRFQNLEAMLNVHQQSHHWDTCWRKKKCISKGEFIYLRACETSLTTCSFRLWKKGDFRKGGDRQRWLNSPNVYQKVEVLETGTTDPKKITKVEIIRVEAQ